MTVFNGERLEGIHRWHEWLGDCLSPELDVENCAWEIEDGRTCWHIDFRDGDRALVHVTDGALRLDEDGFEVLVDRLRDGSWYQELLREDASGIRIHPDGRIEPLEAEDSEVDESTGHQRITA